MADITLPDGSRIPEYALESTQAEIMKLILSQVKADEKSFKLYTKLVENSAEQLKDNDNLQDLQDEQVETLKGIRKDAKTGANLLGSGINFISDKLVKMGTLGVSAAITAFSTIAKSTYNLGDTIASIATVGLAFDDVNGNTVAAITSLNRLGLSSKEAALLMATSSGAIAQMGKQGFTEFTTAAARMTNSGAAFGLTMSELADIAAEDLDVRRRLGILDQLNATSAAKRSTDLYNQQLKATSILGKSIDAIQHAANLNMENNAEMALRIQSIASKFDPGIADGFIKSLQTFQGNLAASGLSDDIIASIGNEIGASVAFASEQGQELFATLSYVGDRFDSGLTTSILKMNELAKTDPEKVGAEMKNFREKLLETAGKMSDVEFDELSQMLLSNGMGEMGKQFALSIGEMRIANKRFGEGTAKQLNTLAQGSKTFDNAMNQLSGGMSGILNDISGALGPTVGSLASAFEDVVNESGVVTKDNMGISTAFKLAMTNISGSLAHIFGDLGEDGKNLGDTLREKVVPKIHAFADWFTGDGVKQLKNGFDFIGGMMSGFGEVLGFVKYLITDKLMPAFSAIADMLGFNKPDVDEDGNVIETSTNFADLGKKVALSVAAFIALSKTVKMVNAGMGAMKAVRGMFGGGGAAATAAGSAGSAAGGAAAKTGAGIAKLGKGIGRGVGAIFSGLGKGLAAVPALAVKGAMYIAGAISILAAGVKGAAFILNLGGEDGLKQLSSGFASFNDIDGMNLVKVGAGLTALGVGLAAFGAGSVMGALGNLVGGVMDSMNEFFGGTSIFDKVAEFGNYNFAVDKIKNNADAIVAYGLAMGALGAGQGLSSVGNMVSSIIDSVVGLFRGDTPLEKVQKFGEMNLDSEGIKKTASAIFAYSIAMSNLTDVTVPGATISSFFKGIGEGLLGMMGAESPLEKLAEFGKSDISASGVIYNSEAVLNYAQAMSKLKGVDVANLDSATEGLLSDDSLKAFTKIKEFGELDIGTANVRNNARGLGFYADSFAKLAEIDVDAAVAAIEKLSKAYDGFNELNPERLQAVADGMAAINQNAIEGVSLNSISSALATNMTATTTPTTTLNTDMGKGPTTTGLGNLKADTTNPTPSSKVISLPVIPSEESRKDSKPNTDKELVTETLESLIKKTNQKLDNLIAETQRNR